MRFISRAFVFGLALLAFIGDLHAAATPSPAPGEGPSVKPWTGKDVDALANASKPVCLYLFVTAKAGTTESKALEGAAFLAHADVSSKLADFNCAKLNISKKEALPKSWQAGPAYEIVKEALPKRAVLILATSDLSRRIVFRGGKSSDPSALEATPANFAAAAAQIQKFQEPLKAANNKKKSAEVAAQKEEAKKEKEEEEKKKKEKDPILAGLQPKDDKDEKGKGDKKPEPKKPIVPTDE